MKSEHVQLMAITATVFTVGLTATTPPTNSGNFPGVVRDTVSFAQHVMPIIERTCQQCHGGVGPDGEIVIEEGLDMTTYEKLMAGSAYGTVIEPGDPDASYLVELILSGDMPKEGDTLTEAEIALISQWIAGGAANN